MVRSESPIGSLIPIGDAGAGAALIQVKKRLQAVGAVPGRRKAELLRIDRWYDDEVGGRVGIWDIHRALGCGGAVTNISPARHGFGADAGSNYREQARAIGSLPAGAGAA